MDSELQTALNDLWGGIVKSYHADPFGSEVRLEGSIIDCQKEGEFVSPNDRNQWEAFFSGVTQIIFLKEMTKIGKNAV